MKRTVVALTAVVSLSVSAVNRVQATTDQATVTSRYFEQRDDFTSGSTGTYIEPWRLWLQTHRAIEQRPPFARKLAARRLDEQKNLLYELRRLGLSRSEIERQPTHVYTLQIVIYEREKWVRKFLNRYWLRHRLEQRKVYENVIKGLRLYVNTEALSKSNPLYVEWERVKGRMMIHVRYGVYASVADANRDRRVLERHLGWKLQVLRRPLTEKMIDKMWIEPVAGRYLNALDAIQ